MTILNPSSGLPNTQPGMLLTSTTRTVPTIRPSSTLYFVSRESFTVRIYLVYFTKARQYRSQADSTANSADHALRRRSAARSGCVATSVSMSFRPTDRPAARQDSLITPVWTPLLRLWRPPLCRRPFTNRSRSQCYHLTGVWKYQECHFNRPPVNLSGLRSGTGGASVPGNQRSIAR